MEPALRLLLKLRFRGWLRRVGRGLRNPRGIVFTLLGLMVFAPAVLSTFLTGRPTPEHLAAVRRFAPIGLLVYCVLGLVTTGTSETAIAFSPAEVNLLFPGPFRRRALLLYKIAAALGACLLVTPFMTVFFSQHGAWLLAEAVGTFLAFAFLQLFAMSIGLAADAIAAFAVDRRRKLVLAGIVVLLAAALVPLGRDLLLLGPLEIAASVERSAAARVVLAPFRPFVLAFTAERAWPDLVVWGGVALAIDAALIGFVLVLDAQYLETSAAASAKLYARLERARRGGGALAWRRSTTKAGRSLPMPPRWGGIGPILWRQLVTARRDFVRLLLFLVIFAPMLVPLLVARGDAAGRVNSALILEGVALGMAAFLTSMLMFDFRGDLDRMAELKALPIASWRAAAGQVAAPVLLVTAVQWAVLALLGLRVEGLPGRYWGIAAFALPINALMVGIDNLGFLLFPMRLGGGGTAGIQAMGWAIALMFAKLIVAGVVSLLVAGLGLAAYYLSGENLAAALSVGWIVLAGCALLLLPMIALAFDRFDVARDVPA